MKGDTQRAPRWCLKGTVLLAGALSVPPGLADTSARLAADPVFLQWIPYVLVTALLVIVGFLVIRIGSLLNRLEREVAERTSELGEANRKLKKVARIDPLTGLLNRRAYQAEAEVEIKRVLRSDRPFTLVLADIDNLKELNDCYGRQLGDVVLRRVAGVLSSQVREVDRLARWGGGEFILLLPETDQTGAALVAEKLRSSVEGERFLHEGKALNVTLTLGVAEHRRGENLDTTLVRADTALVQGKRRGRNRVMIGNYKGLTLVR